VWLDVPLEDRVDTVFLTGSDVSTAPLSCEATPLVSVAEEDEEALELPLVVED
jgi:hypothetical protein